MGLTLLAIAYIIYRIVKEIAEPEIPAEYCNNWCLMGQDRTKVICGQMTKREFNRNLRNGKYR